MYQLPQDSITEPRNVDVILMLCFDLCVESEESEKNVNSNHKDKFNCK